MYRSEQSDQYLEAMTEAVLKTPTNSAVALISNQVLMDEQDFRPVMDELDLPVLFVASSQEWAVGEAEMVRERWPEVQVAVIEDAGHALFVDRPEEFNRVLEDFLAVLPKERVMPCSRFAGGHRSCHAYISESAVLAVLR